MYKEMFKTKPLESISENIQGEKGGLKRVLGPKNLVALGVGGIIGAGIFVLSGQVAAQYTGPAIILSFIIAGISCVLAGFCYAEFASMIPVSGSAYTYTYVTMGEFMAWIIGWNLILEYLFASATVAVGWSGYLTSFLADFNIHIPSALAGAPFDYINGKGWITTGCIINLPSVFIVTIITALLIVGIKESASFNNLMVFIKVSAILIFIAVGLFFIQRSNLHPFIPKNTGTFGHFGISGILRGAGVIFFAYIGFDAVSTAAQESKNPQKDMPTGILASLGISTVLYILVALVLTGIVSYTMLNVSDPIAVGVNAMGEKVFWLRPIIKIAAIAGLTSVVLVMLMAQPRIFYTMSKDGLLPEYFAKVHKKYKTPVFSSVITGLAALILAGLFPINILGELVSIGTLMAFMFVCISVIILRKTKPNAERPFKTPWVPFIPILGALVCFAQMLFLSQATWIRLLVWMVLGILIYVFYGVKHSTINRQK
jgi:APA family basic amino acid/polyamine antiporter